MASHYFRGAVQAGGGEGGGVRKLPGARQCAKHADGGRGDQGKKGERGAARVGQSQAQTLQVPSRDRPPAAAGSHQRGTRRLASCQRRAVGGGGWRRWWWWRGWSVRRARSTQIRCPASSRSVAQCQMQGLENYPSRWYSLLAPERGLVAHGLSSTHMWFRDWDAWDEWKPRETPLSASVRMEHSRWGAPRIGSAGGVVPVSPLWLRASHAGPTDPLLPPGPP